ncbi:MAG: LPXTG cell wall anchor domain-containing protein, partial [Oscillospiraceae bacterium]
PDDTFAVEEGYDYTITYRYDLSYTPPEGGDEDDDEDDDPQDPIVIPDEKIPTGNTPFIIPDEKIPLGKLPTSGGSRTLVGIGLTALALGALSFRRKKQEDDEQ